MDRRDADFLRALQPEDRSILVFMKDSFSAGNCQAGTEAFLKKNGWQKYWCIPANWLIPLRDRPEVMRVQKAVVRRLEGSGETALTQTG